MTRSFRVSLSVALGAAGLALASCSQAVKSDASAKEAVAASERSPAPGFVVQQVNGTGTFSLAEARGEWVAVHFLLKTDCPICRSMTDTYATRADEVPGVRHVFLKPDAVEDTKAWIAGWRQGKDAPAIYRDVDAEIAERYGIRDGYEFHGEVVHYPALVIIDPQGREAYRHIGDRTQDRVPFDTFKEIMAELRG
ncbi:MAG: TlpA family protein disulfide reductase [Phycisphaerales bacterium JB037]